MKFRIMLLWVAALFPFAFGDLGPIEEFLWVEWMAPLFLISMLYLILTEQSYVNYKEKNIFFVALIVFVVVTLINYVKNPVTSHELFGASTGSSGIRSYYTIFIGVCLFLIGHWMLMNDKLNFNSLFLLLIIISLAAGILRAFSYFLEFDTPLLFSEFHYAPPPTEYGGSIAHRIGGLDRVTRIGLPAVFAYYYKKQWNIFAILLVAAFLILMYLGGGRSIFLGVAFAAAVYFMILHKQRLGFLLLLIAVLIVAFQTVSSLIAIPEQFNRIFSYEGGLIQQSLPRGYLFKFYVDSFLSSPFWGKGISYIELGLDGEYLNAFVTTNIMIGGHGAYLSIIALFGLGGAFYLGVFLFGSIFYHLRFLKSTFPEMEKYSDLSLFILLSLLIKTATYVVGGSGYNDFSLYIFAGLTAGFVTKIQTEKSNRKLDVA
ncbi:O-antigen ligase family protein [candidate division KSB1 bacterium]|nr:O-antigen ligase family protein [candidate division KSB1 bacterium]